MSNIRSQQLHLQDQTRGYIEEDCEDAQSMYEYFLKACRPVAKSYGHDIAEESAFASIKYPAEENDAENESEEHDDDNSEMVDHQHKFFIDHLRPDGNSYVLDIFNDKVFVKYHDEPSIPEPEALTLFAIENTDHVLNAAAVLDRKPKCPKLNVDESGNGSSGSHLFAIKNASRALYAAVKVDTEMHAPAVYAVKRRGRGRKPKEVSELHATTNPNGKGNHMASEIDKHEHAGKRRRKRAKRNVVLSAEGQTIDNEIKEESEDYGYDTPQRRRPVHNPVLNAAIFCDDNNDEANSMKDTEYKEKLMKELNKPYCQEEYERLLKDIYVRKPAQGEKVLRGRNISYKKDYASPSYLDHHIDLERKINSARDDHPKVLNLLRGFFYWLTYSPQENSFKPWRVSLCLDVRPACRISRK